MVDPRSVDAEEWTREGYARELDLESRRRSCGEYVAGRAGKESG